MRLVRRLRGSTTVEIAPPRGILAETDTEAILPLENINNAPYAKFFSATKQQVLIDTIYKVELASGAVSSQFLI